MTIGLFLNATTFNQGNHCIVTFNQDRSPIDDGNQALLGNVDTCAALEKDLQQQMQALANAFFASIQLAKG